MKLSKILLLVAVLLIIVWSSRSSSSEYFTDEEKSKALKDTLKYVEETEDLSEEPFTVAGMIDKYIDDDEAGNIIEASGNNDKNVITEIIKKYM